MKFKELFNDEWLPDWDAILRITEFAAMGHCEQSSVWHKEGNALVHTKQVTEHLINELAKIGVYPSDDPYYVRMVSAAICHDIGKPSTTVFSEEKGDYTTRCHGNEGARITRRLFFDDDFVMREDVCYMVRHHMDLHHVFDKPELVEKKLIGMSIGRVSIKDMLLLNICDSLGSLNDFETPDTVERHFLMVKNASEALGCYDSKFKFVRPEARHSFFHDRDCHDVKDAKSIKYRFYMYVMIGTPGSGKDTWIKKNLSNYKTLCRDDIRKEIGLQGEKPQGTKEQEERVTQIFNDRLKEYCKDGIDFVVNNTNVRKCYRDVYNDVAMEYGACVVYVYVEAPSLHENKKRREGMMPLSVIDRMWGQLDFP
ncbi:MAG: AAA family ATPase, partial [Paludibacteraceae bacterium]|nr:AAA family ATPase [Paludibacteraceae bacterium]